MHGGRAWAMLSLEGTTMSDPAPKQANKRLSRRCPAKGTTRLKVYRNAMGLGPNIATTLLDLSETGLRVILKESLTAGQQVEVNLESASTGKTIKTKAGVVWVVPGADAKFVVGLRLEKSLAHADLMALTKP